MKKFRTALPIIVILTLMTHGERVGQNEIITENYRQEVKMEIPLTVPLRVEKEIVIPVEEVKGEQGYREDIPLSKDLQGYIKDLCGEYGVEVAEVYAVIDVESDFKADLISETDDYGLMQINKVNHKELREKLGVKDFLNPYDNVKAGIYILSKLQYLDEHSRYMAYNMGVGGMKKALSRGNYSSRYSREVMKEKGKY